MNGPIRNKWGMMSRDVLSCVVGQNTGPVVTKPITSGKCCLYKGVMVLYQIVLLNADELSAVFHAILKNCYHCLS